MALKKGDLFSTPVLGKGRTVHKVTALENYSTGKPHGGIDIGQCPIGTSVHAPFDGKVVAAHDGVANNRPGEKVYSGKPSNWILLLVKMKTNYGTTQDATLFFQHLSPGLKVKVGQKVKRGQLLALTGNSGFSSGPHLHLGAQWVRKGRGHGAETRYDHVANLDLRIWPPERFLDLGNLPDDESDVTTWFDITPKPATKLIIPRGKKVLLDVRPGAAKIAGLESHLVYLNCEIEWDQPDLANRLRAFTPSAALRVSYIRDPHGSEVKDPTAYQDFDISAGYPRKTFLITHNHRELGDLRRGGVWAFDLHEVGGAKRLIVSTRYAKADAVKGKRIR